MTASRCVRASASADVVAADRVLVEAQRRHDAVDVGSEACLVVPALRLVGMPGTPEVDSDDRVPTGKLRHHVAPRPPSLRKTVDQDERGAVAADDCVHLDVADPVLSGA